MGITQFLLEFLTARLKVCNLRCCRLQLALDVFAYLLLAVALEGVEAFVLRRQFRDLLQQVGALALEMCRWCAWRGAHAGRVRGLHRAWVEQELVVAAIPMRRSI